MFYMFTYTKIRAVRISEVIPDRFDAMMLLSLLLTSCRFVGRFKRYLIPEDGDMFLRNGIRYASTRLQNPDHHYHHPHCREKLRSDKFRANVELQLSDMSRVALGMATAVFAETLGNSQYSTRPIPERRSFTLNASSEILRSRNLTSSESVCLVVKSRNKTKLYLYVKKCIVLVSFAI
jgi:hypothetical protein